MKNSTIRRGMPVSYDENGNRVRSASQKPYWSRPENQKLVKRVDPPSIVPFPQFSSRIDLNSGLPVPYISNARGIERAIAQKDKKAHSGDQDLFNLSSDADGTDSAW